MADIARAMQTPPPPAPEQSKTILQPGYDPAGEADAKRAAKNERDRLRRKAKRAADLKAAQQVATKKAVAPKRKAKKRKKVAAAPAVPAKRGRGRPPGSKNKGPGRPPGSRNKPPLMDTVFPKAVIPASKDLLTQIGLAVTLLNAMPEHARKVVLDAVK